MKDCGREVDDERGGHVPWKANLYIYVLFPIILIHYGGKILVPKSPTTGSICEIVTTLPQVFQRVQADNFASLPDARFEQFTTKVRQAK